MTFGTPSRFSNLIWFVVILMIIQHPTVDAEWRHTHRPNPHNGNHNHESHDNKVDPATQTSVTAGSSSPARVLGSASSSDLPPKSTAFGRRRLAGPTDADANDPSYVRNVALMTSYQY
mmetsp:Transcript_20145/g.56108  ORF Transcript_20145/g.56108 Transcript_20145/m.56108 type:complete len:118 (+) Transcript_20145:355-708(+)